MNIREQRYISQFIYLSPPPYVWSENINPLHFFLFHPGEPQKFDKFFRGPVRKR